MKASGASAVADGPAEDAGDGDRCGDSGRHRGGGVDGGADDGGQGHRVDRGRGGRRVSPRPGSPVHTRLGGGRGGPEAADGGLAQARCPRLRTARRPRLSCPVPTGTGASISSPQYAGFAVIVELVRDPVGPPVGRAFPAWRPARRRRTAGHPRPEPLKSAAVTAAQVSPGGAPRSHAARALKPATCPRSTGADCSSPSIMTNTRWLATATDLTPPAGPGQRRATRLAGEAPVRCNPEQQGEGALRLQRRGDPSTAGGLAVDGQPPGDGDLGRPSPVRSPAPAAADSRPAAGVDGPCRPGRRRSEGSSLER